MKELETQSQRRKQFTGITIIIIIYLKRTTPIRQRIIIKFPLILVNNVSTTVCYKLQNYEIKMDGCLRIL